MQSVARVRFRLALKHGWLGCWVAAEGLCSDQQCSRQASERNCCRRFQAAPAGLLVPTETTEERVKQGLLLVNVGREALNKWEIHEIGLFGCGACLGESMLAGTWPRASRTRSM